MHKLVTKVPKFVLENEDRRGSEVSIVFIDDEEMRKLNMRYRKKNETTDILSFRLNEGKFADLDPNVLGDIAISLPQAEKQAAEYGITIDCELTRLLVHGVLHLLGYDHIDPEDSKIMMPLQESYIEAACKLFHIK